MTLNRISLCLFTSAIALALSGCSPAPDVHNDSPPVITNDGRVGVKVDDAGINLGKPLEDLSEKTVKLGRFENYELLLVDHQPLPFFALLTSKESFDKKQAIKESNALKAAMASAFGENQIDAYLPYLSDAIILLIAMQTPDGQYWNPTEHPGPSPLGLPPLIEMSETQKNERIALLLKALSEEDITFTSSAR